MKKIFILILSILIIPDIIYGLSFKLPKAGYMLIGEPQTTQIKAETDDFSNIGEKFDVGYYEVYEANPGIDPDNPAVGTVLVIPTKYILPSELKRNTIVINLAEMRLYYLPSSGDHVYIFPIGIGKEDWETPIGETTVVEKIKNPKWVVPDSVYKFRKLNGFGEQRVIPPGPDNPLGKYKLRLANPAYLIHGTNVPEGIGRRGTAGCIRLYPKDIELLFNLVNIGTRVITINKPYKVGWNDNKLYLEAHMPLFEQRLEMGESVKPVFDLVSEATKNHHIIGDWVKVAKVAREHLTIPRAIN
jgi:L,D-transpeptidase ErfK/SrfK